MTSFIDQQARAWEEIREWAQEAEQSPLIPMQPGGSWDGPGSSLGCTSQLQTDLSRLLVEREVHSILDIGCGDWNWMRLVDLTGISYTGWDVDPGRIARCRYRAGIGDYTRDDEPDMRFHQVNILTAESVPQVDLVLCRDVLAHLPNGYIAAVIAKARASGSKWLLASTYPCADNEFAYDPKEFAWNGYMEHPVDLEAPPYSLQKVDALPEDTGPGGVISRPHELGLFLIGAT